MLTGYLYHCIWFVIAHCYKYLCICVRIDKNWVRVEHEGSPFFNRKSDKVFLSDGWVLDSSLYKSGENDFILISATFTLSSLS